MTWQTLGFATTKKFFENAITNGQLSHAYIFTGQEMIGKLAFSLELTSRINSSNPGANLDVLLVKSEGDSISIGEIREAKRFLSLSPNVGPYKFVIIDNAEQMTIEAQNAFLKVLEEATESSIIILITAFEKALLPTIYSRCQEMQFVSHSAEAIKEALYKEGISQEKSDFLSKFVNGRMGLALHIARENKFDDLKGSIEEFAQLKKQPLSERLKLAQTLADEEKTPDLPEKVLYWMLYLKMQSPETHKSSLQNLIDLNYHLGQPQFNRRLMVEDFMVKL